MNVQHTSDVENILTSETGGVVFDINVPGQTMEAITTKYDKWTSYEKDVQEQDWKAPQLTAEAVEAYYPVSTRQHVRILDVGAGTGMLAIKLRKAGFTNIDGLDPSSGMLDQARERNLYDNYIQAYLSAKPLDDTPEDVYDIVTGSGCFSPNHIPAEALNEVIRIVKPGGIVFLTTKHITRGYWKNLCVYEDELQVQGAWQQVERVVKPVFRIGFECMLHVYKVL